MNATYNSAKSVSANSKNHPDIIIRGGTLLSMARGEPPMENSVVIIEEDRIIDIVKSPGKYPAEQGAQIIDAENCVVMPGLVNSHAHIAMTIFRGYADDLPLKQWLFEKIFPAEAEFLNPENVFWGSLLGCLEMIASGTTSFLDGYFFQDETVKATHKSGLRAVIAQGVVDFPAPGVPDPDKNLTVGREFIDKWLNFSELITPGLFCHSPVTCSDRTLKEGMKISRYYSLPMQIHLSETSEEVEEILKRSGKRPVPYLDELGILDRSLIAAHSVHLEREEIDLLAERGVGIVHAPESNMKLSSGAAPVAEMVKKGIRAGLGTDGCASNNDLDMFKEMDSAAKLGKVITRDPVNMPAETVLRMSTVGGAELMGLEKETGSIEKGKKADIIVVDMNSPHLVPLYNPVSSIVYSAKGSDVKDVIVNGKVLMKDREFTTLDPEEIMDRVRAIGQKIRMQG